MGNNPTELESFDEPYAEEIDEIRRTIEESRERISSTLSELHEEVEEKLDWRLWVRKNPWRAVGAAAFLGFYIGIN